MPVQPTYPQLRAFVSLSVLAEDILGLSRARVYELIERGALPRPVYDLRSKRPVFTEEQQRQAVAVRQSGLGINGEAVIFYRRRHGTPLLPPAAAPARARRRSSRAPDLGSHADLVSGLQALGVAHADERTVAAAVAECFPNGLDGQQESEVLRVLFRHLRRRETA